MLTFTGKVLLVDVFSEGWGILTKLSQERCDDGAYVMSFLMREGAVKAC